MSNQKYPAAYAGQESTAQTFAAAGVPASAKREQAEEIGKIGKELWALACKFQEAVEVYELLGNLSGQCEELALELMSDKEEIGQ